MQLFARSWAVPGENSTAGQHGASLKAVVVAAVVACPVAYLIAGTWLENYSYRIDNHWWVYLLAFLVMALVALLSVTWQTLRLINLLVR